jgi:hypothetical protein
MRALTAGLMVGAIGTAAHAMPFVMVPGQGTILTIVDQGSIASMDGRKAFWSYTFPNPMKPAPKDIFYVAYRSTVDCDGERTKTIAAVTYDIQNSMVVSSGEDAEWSSSPPGSLGDQEINLVCKGVPLPSGTPLDVADIQTFVAAMRKHGGYPQK